MKLYSIKLKIVKIKGETFTKRHLLPSPDGGTYSLNLNPALAGSIFQRPQGAKESVVKHFELT
jgi:hypothetical protein